MSSQYLKLHVYKICPIFTNVLTIIGKKKNAHNSLNLIPTIKKYLSLSNTAFDVRPFPKMPSLSKTVHCADKYLHYPKQSTFFTNVLIISKTSTGPHNDTQTGAHHQLSE